MAWTDLIYPASGCSPTIMALPDCFGRILDAKAAGIAARHAGRGFTSDGGNVDTIYRTVAGTMTAALYQVDTNGKVTSQTGADTTNATVPK
jgi:hypothetical protein